MDCSVSLEVRDSQYRELIRQGLPYASASHSAEGAKFMYKVVDGKGNYWTWRKGKGWDWYPLLKEGA